MRRATIPLTALILTLLLLGCELFIEEPQAGNVYAILVALDYHGTAQELEGTIPDARELNLVLESVTAKSKAGTYNGYLFLEDKDDPSKDLSIGGLAVDSLPTSGNLLDAIAALKQTTTSNDLIILTYSGHGSETGKLLLAESGETTNEEFSASFILDALKDVPGRKLMILDTCYSGLSVPESGASHSTLLNNNISKWYKKYWDSSRYTKPEVIVLTASTDTKSYEQATANGHSHGVFTFALLKALGWDHPHGDISTITPDSLPNPPAIKGSILSADSLYTYVKDYKSPSSWTSLFSPFGQGQHPMVSGGALDMVLFTF